MKTAKRKFARVPIKEFDARRGYSRWILPGVGTRTSERGSLAVADLWVSRRGDLVTRFKSLGFTLHFEIVVIPQSPITVEMELDIADFLLDMLRAWIVDGVDDDLECDDIIYVDTDA